MSENLSTATFAAGCFWGVEDSFMKIDGVKETSVGYMGGRFKNPTYFDVCTGITGHAEVVNLKFDPNIISFRELCLAFFCISDPTTLNRQGPDVGTQYRSSIFIHNSEQKQEAKLVIDELNKKKFNSLIVTQLEDAAEYYEAEDYHQKYIQKNNLASCGG